MRVWGKRLGCRQHVERMNCIIKKVASAYWLQRSRDRIVEGCPGSAAVPRPEWEIAGAGGRDNELLQMETAAYLNHTFLFHFDRGMWEHKVTHVCALTPQKCKWWILTPCNRNYGANMILLYKRQNPTSTDMLIGQRHLICSLLYMLLCSIFCLFYLNFEKKTCCLGR